MKEFRVVQVVTEKTPGPGECQKKQGDSSMTQMNNFRRIAKKNIWVVEVGVVFWF